MFPGTIKTILVVHKKSALQTAKEQGNVKVLSLVENRHPSVSRYVSSSMEHQASFQKLKNFLADTGRQVLWATKEDDLAALVKVNNPDLVVTLGGDGTVLTTAKLTDSTVPLVGINSAPSHSVGALTCGPVDNFINKVWPRLLNSSMAALPKVVRLQVKINDVLISSRVLNDVLYAASHPAATSRYTLVFKTLVGEAMEDEQKSSGIWVCTPAGSTGAMASAGGSPMGLQQHDCLQYRVRELYRNSHNMYTPYENLVLEGNLINPGETLSVVNKTTDALVSLDGPENTHKLSIGDTVEFSHSPEPLTLVTQ